MEETIIHDLEQGSKKWLQFRQKYHGASDAAAMLGLSPYMTREELLHKKFTLHEEKTNTTLQAIYDKGHETEKQAMVALEQHYEVDLFPLVCSKGGLSASLDGATLDLILIVEHKQYNNALMNAIISGKLPDQYQPQCQQIMYVTGADRVLFVCSDGSLDRMFQINVLRDENWIERIIAGWQQFDKDLANYKPKNTHQPKASELQKAPKLSVVIQGKVISSNLPQFLAESNQFIEQINTNLTTDQDFADAEHAVKRLKSDEAELKGVEAKILAQADDIYAVINAINESIDIRRVKRLELDRLVKAKKVQLRKNIIDTAMADFMLEMEQWQETVKPIQLKVMPNFEEAIKNKKTLASLHNAVDTELANAKSRAMLEHEDITRKLHLYNEISKGYQHLFYDLKELAEKDLDSFKLAIQLRISEAKEAEKAKEAEQEKTRQKIAGQPTDIKPPSDTWRQGTEPTETGEQATIKDLSHFGLTIGQAEHLLRRIQHGGISNIYFKE